MCIRDSINHTPGNRRRCRYAWCDADRPHADHRQRARCPAHHVLQKAVDAKPASCVNGNAVSRTPRIHCMLSVLRRKSTAERLGRSPGSEGADRAASRFTFPSNRRVAFRSGEPSLTVAGPRRTCTGLPCYAHRGHPKQRQRLYHAPPRVSRIRLVIIPTAGYRR